MDVEVGAPRESSIKRFLAKPPKSAQSLKLEAVALGTESPVLLAEWQNDDELVPALCKEIVLLCSETAAEMNAPLVCTLSYWTATAVKIGPEKVLNIRNPNAGQSLTLDSTAQQLTGDYTSQAVQAQKHHEVMAKMYLMHLSQLLQSSRDSAEHAMGLADRLASKLIDQERRTDQAERRAEAAEEILTTVQESEGTDSEVNASQAAIMQQIGPFLPQIIAGVMRALSPGLAAGPATPTE